MGDKRHDKDLDGFIRSRLTGQLDDVNDLDDATKMLFKKSTGSFVYMASMVASFEGDKKWTITELEGLPHGLDGVYCDYFARILEPNQDDVPYAIGEVSKSYYSVVTQYLV